MEFTQYPPKNDSDRIELYKKYAELLEGEHYNAFNISATDFGQNYPKIKYITSNFAGMVSRLSADLLFEEFPKIKSEKNGDFIKGLIDDTTTGLSTQLYESALTNSAKGDAVFRIRAENGEVVIEEMNPEYYYQIVDHNNVRLEPKAHVFMWKNKMERGDKVIDIVTIEKHEKGLITTEVRELNNSDIGELVEDPIEEETGIDEFLVVHIPNYKTHDSRWGVSDYQDIKSLMYALNNRVTQIENILDKHGDPILAVPEGVLDENGNVRKEKFGVIEIGGSPTQNGKPEYIVWDAKLESAFKQIDYLVDTLFLVTETSKSLFNLDTAGGQAESGRALKYRLLRTLSKKHRKELYYDRGIKNILYVAQLFANANNLTINGVKTKEPEMVTIEWQDGIINDQLEVIEGEVDKLDNGLTTKEEAIANIDGITVEEATEKAQKIKEQKAEEAPQFTARPFLNNNLEV